MQLHIILLEPEIPQNTGNIARTCVATGAKLHLIKPYGFSLDEKSLKRAGLDYWNRLKLVEHSSWGNFLRLYPELPLFFATTKGENIYSDVSYPIEAGIVFGKESKGIREDILAWNRKRCIRLPMLKTERSLNVSNTVAILTYEFLRQHAFANLQTRGELHEETWKE